MLIMLIVRGVTQVFNVVITSTQSAIISGLSGLDHIIMLIAFIMLFRCLFQLDLPDNFFDKSYERKIKAIENKFIEVDYRGLEEWIIIRKSLYYGEEDISGDYNEYPEERTELYGDIKVLLRGNEGKINVISWRDGDYVYSVNINPGGIGIDEEVLYEMTWQVD